MPRGIDDLHVEEQGLKNVDIEDDYVWDSNFKTFVASDPSPRTWCFAVTSPFLFKPGMHILIENIGEANPYAAVIKRIDSGGSFPSIFVLKGNVPIPKPGASVFRLMAYRKIVYNKTIRELEARGDFVWMKDISYDEQKKIYKGRSDLIWV